MDKLDTLRDLERRAENGGGQERVDRQHQAGKLTARERMDVLFDRGTFQELDKLVVHRSHDFGMDEQRIPGDGVVSGHGRIDGRLVFAFAQDFTVFGGSLSETNAQKIVQDHGSGDEDRRTDRRIERLGRRPHSGRRGVARRLRRYLPAQHAGMRCRPADLRRHGPLRGRRRLFAGHYGLHRDGEDTSYMFVTGPDVIHTVTHEDVTKEELGGAATHNERSGVAHFAVDDDRDCLALIRELLSFLPGNNLEDPPRRATDDPPIAPMTRSIRSSRIAEPALRHARRDPPRRRRWRLLRGARALCAEYRGGICEAWRPTGRGRRQSARDLAGTLDIDASVKARASCDSATLQYSTLTFEDVPGFLPGTVQEYGGIIRHGAKLLFAFAEATVPKSL